MNDKKLYLKIYRNALFILTICSAITYLVTRKWMYVVSTIFGGILAMIGFLAIILFTYHVSFDGNVRGKFTGAYLFRYLLYFICLFFAMKIGLNIVSMLIGFLCINLAIKFDTFFTRKEED